MCLSWALVENELKNLRRKATNHFSVSPEITTISLRRLYDPYIKSTTNVLITAKSCKTSSENGGKTMNKTKYMIGVIGLGYVGAPLSVAFGEKYKTLGYDIDVDVDIL